MQTDRADETSSVLPFALSDRWIVTVESERYFVKVRYRTRWYSRARTSYLEDATEQLIREALPSATVYRAVCWSDAAAGKDWENDVVAVLGNHIFLFEAKSGRVKPAARRGGLESLRKNFRQLYIEPGEQAARLELLL